MVDAKKRLVALAVLAGVGLSGCELNQKDPNYPDSITPTTFTATLQRGGAARLRGRTTRSSSARPTARSISRRPYNAAPFTLIGTPLNTQDGWSISAPTNTSFSQSIDGSTLAGSVRVVEVYLSNTTKFPASAAELPPGVTSPVSRVLTPGVDYVAAVSTDIDSAGKILRINPLKPLRPSTGATNIGYMVFLTNGIHDTSGQSLRTERAPTLRTSRRRPTAATSPLRCRRASAALPSRSSRSPRRPASTRPMSC